jgi:hypothetical protein
MRIILSKLQARHKVPTRFVSLANISALEDLFVFINGRSQEESQNQIFMLHGIQRLGDPGKKGSAGSLSVLVPGNARPITARASSKVTPIVSNASLKTNP